MGLGANRRCLYVGGLTRQVTEQVLHAAFVPFGPIKEIQIPSDTDVGASRGFGFVEYEEEDDAIDAIDNMDESELFGQTLRVCVAKANRAELGSEKPVWAEVDVEQEEITPSAENAVK
ncbi:hypothetical protein ABG067_000468 [Albugo candida]|uniref:RRM domain-containing protein n=1 Tax=Albugo candida TaxID=65357 RepID=A0A024FXP4_9STRA|nr:unnamed protein product [Albugo candida]|eukprot:CCI39280.1 unnamed protein product [Albugo candida]